MTTDTRLDLRGLRPGSAAEGQGIVLESGIWVPHDVVLGLTSDDSSVTITNNGDGTLDLAAVGGGGGGVTYPLDPASLHPTYGDDFTAASLNAKWNRVGYTSSGEVFQQGPMRAFPGHAASYFRQTTDATSNKYYWQAAPSGDFTVVMRCAIAVSSTTSMFGPMILDSSGNGVVAAVYNTGDAYWVLGCTAGAYNSTNNAVLGPYSGYVWQGGETWYRLNKTGTAYKASISTNGIDWLPYTSTITFATTPTRIGFGNIFGTVSEFAIDWFDVQ